MVTNSSREMQKDREKIRPPFGGLKFCQATDDYLLTYYLYLFSHLLKNFFIKNNQYLYILRNIFNSHCKN